MQNTYPRVSILVLSYKNTQYLNDCLDSIFSQAYPNIEIICSNDGCDTFDSDAILEYINNHKSKNITNVIMNKNSTNLGTVRHCNKLLGMATGDYIMFIACDDCYNNEMSVYDMVNGFGRAPEGVYSIAGQTNMMNTDLTKTLWHFTNDEMKIKINELTPQELYKNHLAIKAVFIGGGVIYKKEVFEKFGKFDEAFFLLEDWTSAIKFAKAGMRTYYLDINVLNHRAGGMSSAQMDSESFAHKMYTKDYIVLLSRIIMDKTLSDEVMQKVRSEFAFKTHLFAKVFDKNILTELSIDKIFANYIEHNDTESNFVNTNNKMTCIIFGCKFADTILDLSGEHFDFIGFVDNDSNLKGKEINTKPICEPDAIGRSIPVPDAIIIYSRRYQDEMAKQIKGLNIKSKILIPIFDFTKKV